MSASFIYSNPNLYTLGPSESLKLDPFYEVFRAEYSLTGYIVKYGPVWPPYYQTKVLESSIWAGKQWNGEDDPFAYYWVWRGYVSFDTTLLKNKIVKSAVLHMFLLYVCCEDEYGGVGLGFSLEFYSGKNQWTGTSDLHWDDCETGEGEFMFVNANTPTRQYYWKSVNKNSINVAGSGTLRTQFKFKLYADTVGPPYSMDAIQNYAFDNPYDNPHAPDPKLYVTYEYP